MPEALRRRGLACAEALVQDDVHPLGVPEAHHRRVEEKHLTEGAGHLALDLFAGFVGGWVGGWWGTQRGVPGGGGLGGWVGWGTQRGEERRGLEGEKHGGKGPQEKPSKLVASFKGIHGIPQNRLIRNDSYPEHPDPDHSLPFGIETKRKLRG